jgi:hypothetical protein
MHVDNIVVVERFFRNCSRIQYIFKEDSRNVGKMTAWQRRAFDSVELLVMTYPRAMCTSEACAENVLSALMSNTPSDMDIMAYVQNKATEVLEARFAFQTEGGALQTLGGSLKGSLVEMNGTADAQLGYDIVVTTFIGLHLDCTGLLLVKKLLFLTQKYSTKDPKPQLVKRLQRVLDVFKDGGVADKLSANFANTNRLLTLNNVAVVMIMMDAVMESYGDGEDEEEDDNEAAAAAAVSAAMLCGDVYIASSIKKVGTIMERKKGVSLDKTSKMAQEWSTLAKGMRTDPWEEVKIFKRVYGINPPLK